MGYQPARWLAAAALDRWLMIAGLPQKYGTQFRQVGTSYELWMVDPTTTDDEPPPGMCPRWPTNSLERADRPSTTGPGRRRAIRRGDQLRGRALGG